MFIYMVDSPLPDSHGGRSPADPFSRSLGIWGSTAQWNVSWDYHPYATWYIKTMKNLHFDQPVFRDQKSMTG